MKKSALFRSVALILTVVSSFLLIAFAAYAADGADDFISAVDAIADSTGLLNKKEAIDYAEAKLEAYESAGGSRNDVAVKSYYDIFAEEKVSNATTIAACDSFISYIEQAMLYHMEDMYPETRENLDEAIKLLDSIPTTDPYVSASYGDYKSICDELEQPERYCKEYIETVNQALAATTYEDAAKLLKSAREYKVLIDQTGISGYKGMAEADASIEDVEAFLTSKIVAARPFISAVKALARDDFAGILAAYALLDDIDETTEGVDVMVNKLDTYTDDYNDAVEEANAMMEEALGLASKIA